MVASFLRGCDDKGINDDKEDNSFLYFYRACSDDLCNSGIGKELSTANRAVDDDGEGILRVPGSHGSTTIPKLFTTISIILLVYFNNYIM